MANRNSVIAVFTLLIFIVSCTKETHNPCAYSQIPEGAVCRMYHFLDGQLKQTADYYYENHNLSAIHYFEKGAFSSAVFYSYENNFLCGETTQLPNNQGTIQTFYQYNEFDSLERKTTNSALVHLVTEYEYNEYQQKALQLNYQNNILLYFIRYDYDDEKVLWRMMRFDADSNLASYHLFEYYDNYIKIKKSYNSNYTLTQAKTILQNSLEQNLQIKYYDGDYQLLSEKEFNYESGLLTSIHKKDSQGYLLEVFVYQYQ